jgi:uridine kinase
MSTLRPDPGGALAVAQTVVERTLSRPPTLGTGRLICIDGPAGAGKTTLSAAIELADAAAHVVHCDELLAGWRGLPGLAATVERFLRPLAAGEESAWTRWAWDRDEWAESHTVSPGGLLVLEGTGCWAPAYADLVGTLVWVEAPRDLRLARGMARDGEHMREEWLTWLADEAELHELLGTRAHADVIVDGTGATGPGA